MKTAYQFSSMTPSIDKGLAALGVLVSGLTIADISTGVGISVGVVTFCMIIPRAILNWQELRESNAKRREANEKEKRALKDAENESTDY